MDSRRIVKKYICSATALKVLTAIFAVLTVASLVMVFVAGAGKTVTLDPKETAVEFDSMTHDEGDYAFVDIIGVSENLLDDYYLAEDAYYSYLVRLTDAQFAEMEAQQIYWNRVSEDEEAPEAYRLYGKVEDISDAMISTLSTGFEITEADVTSSLGIQQLDGTATLSPTTVTEKGDNEMWIVFAVMGGMFTLIFGIALLCSHAIANKHLNRLEQLGLMDKAAAELELESNFQVNKDQARLSPSFVFGKGSGFVARYEDIVWCYRKNVRTNFVIVNSFLYIGTRYGKEQSLTSAAISDKFDAFQQTAGRIAQKNPTVMFGYTSQNRKAYKQIVKAEKENGLI